MMIALAIFGRPNENIAHEGKNADEGHEHRDLQQIERHRDGTCVYPKGRASIA